ncbi:MAG: cytochrome c maturation protein CcmE, partial [Desulfovibrio sp.]|nr:cytochrome c maturation protein CcmE [Desulfovibrio sp.]
MAQKKNTSIYLAAALLFAGGLAWFLFSGLSENSVYFLNVAEAKAQDPAKLASARLFGTVAP